MLLLSLSIAVPLSLFLVWQILRENNRNHARRETRLLNQQDALLDRIQYGRAFPEVSAAAAAPEVSEEEPFPQEWAEL